jgi:hypothetical protein
LQEPANARRLLAADNIRATLHEERELLPDD